MTTRPDLNATDLAAAGLFEDLPVPTAEQAQQAQAQMALKRRQGAPRLRQPNRSQVE